jgi:hypothetical protein
MPRRIDIELTSARDDGSWTWRAAGAREPRGVLDGSLLPAGSKVGDVVRAELDLYLEGTDVVAVLPPKTARAEPERLELIGSGREAPLVTAPTSTGERPARRERPPRERDGDRARDRRDSRARRAEGDERAAGPRDRARPAKPPLPEKPKPKRLKPGRQHTQTLLGELASEERPVAEQLLRGGLPGLRQALDKQNETAEAEGKPRINPGPLLELAERLLPRVRQAEWRDRAEAAMGQVDEIDLRDLRSVVTASDTAARDDESRALATTLRDALSNRVDKEHQGWLAELATTIDDGRVVRALRLSSRPPKAGAPLPGDLATKLSDATNAALSAEASSDRWCAVLDALALSPVRRKVVPSSLPAKVSDELRTAIARFADRLPEIAHIFGIEPTPSPQPRADRRRRSPARPPKPGESAEPTADAG